MIAERSARAPRPSPPSQAVEETLGPRDAGDRHDDAAPGGGAPAGKRRTAAARQRDARSKCAGQPAAGSRRFRRRRRPGPRAARRPRRAASSGSRSRPAGSTAAVDVLVAGEQQIDVARQLEMLKPIVEQVDRRAEAALGEPAGQVAIRRDEHRRRPAACRASISGSSPARSRSAQTRVAVADDDDAVGRDRARP